jgi:hypothetical protein
METDTVGTAGFYLVDSQHGRNLTVGERPELAAGLVAFPDGARLNLFKRVLEMGKPAYFPEGFPEIIQEIVECICLTPRI